MRGVLAWRAAVPLLLAFSHIKITSADDCASVLHPAMTERCTVRRHRVSDSLDTHKARFRGKRFRGTPGTAPSQNSTGGAARAVVHCRSACAVPRLEHEGKGRAPPAAVGTGTMPARVPSDICVPPMIIPGLGRVQITIRGDGNGAAQALISGQRTRVAAFKLLSRLHPCAVTARLRFPAHARTSPGSTRTWRGWIVWAASRTA